MQKTSWKDIFKITALPAFVAGLCCFSPIVLVLFGLSSVAFASSLADTFYGQYKWAFRGVGLLLLALSLWFYFRKKGICTLDQAKQHRNKIINLILITFVTGTLLYIIWLYVIVEIIGILLGIWG
ncbi:hypothetical protein COV18_05190 [Candidatus Woesearchaeota archaeon CG10_big_fil_rev_8_21_14_0_10_37_12]|nr:MAG: hypothetical protein COV18_05190 [Candidatus Woesearchaeota archaeon CG10_big_fil_rev_8_21_14_0_10_37_12]